MNLNLQSKVIIVTGGASGIGEKIVQVLAEERAIPCILDRDDKKASPLVESLKQNAKEAYYFKTELTDADACQKSIHQVLSIHNRIDGVVNNAGINDGVGLENGNYERFLSSLINNVGHYYSVSNFALPALKQSKGAIVNIISKTAFTGQGNTSGYAAANGCRVGLTESLAEELAEYSIRVNGIVVAECWTPQYEWWVNQQADSENLLKKIKSEIPLENRMTEAKEIADLAAFLLSDKATGINKQTIFVDGGYVHLDRAIT